MEQNILKGFALRIVLTLGTFSYLPSLHLDKHYYLLLPILLTVLDSTDMIFTRFAKMYTRFYHVRDKIIDSVSYLLAWYVFNLDPIFLYVVLYRLIGVYGYYQTNDKKMFVFFPDVFKEFLFLSGFKLDNTIYGSVVILKMVFEYFLHVYL